MHGTTRLFEFDGGHGDQHVVEFVGRDNIPHGYENLFIGQALSPGYKSYRRSEALKAALMGATSYQHYEIRELK